jgi:hypothetical protein
MSLIVYVQSHDFAWRRRRKIAARIRNEAGRVWSWKNGRKEGLHQPRTQPLTD